MDKTERGVREKNQKEKIAAITYVFLAPTIRNHGMRSHSFPNSL
jgi:hypothetical protein